MCIGIIPSRAERETFALLLLSSELIGVLSLRAQGCLTVFSEDLEAGVAAAANVTTGSRDVVLT